MLDQAAQVAAEAAGPHIGQFATDGVLSPVEPSPGEAPHRRITADSFRALSAKLKKQPFVPPAPEPESIVIPDIISEVRQAAAAPLPAVEWTVTPEVEADAPQVEQFLPQSLAEAEAPQFLPEQFAEPDFEEAVAPQAQTFEPAPVEVYEEHAAPPEVQEVVEPAAPVFEAIVEEAAPAPVVAEPSALPEKLTLAELTKLVYSTPDENDRALYLRELAEILAEETARAEEALSRAAHEHHAPAEADVEEEVIPAPENQEVAEAAPVESWNHLAVEPAADAAAVYVEECAAPESETAFNAAPQQVFVEPEPSSALIEEVTAPAEEIALEEFAPFLIEEAVTDPVFEAEAPASEEPVAPPADISAFLSERLGGAAQLLRKAEEIDPFASQPQLPPAAAAPQEELATEEAEDVARSLLDMMSSTGGSGLPQERALAADTLLRMIPRMPLRAIVSVVERIAMMSQPPELLVARLIRDPRFEVAGPLLERCNAISDQDIAAVIHEGDFAKQRMIARRRILSSPLADKLITYNDTSVLLTLVRNAGASISHEAYYRLAEHAAEHASLLAPLSTRQDLPAPVAFELFWSVPPELRRYLLSRFLTDSETLNKILKITIRCRVEKSRAKPSSPSARELTPRLNLQLQANSRKPRFHWPKSPASAPRMPIASSPIAMASRWRSS
ncbi:MAG: DUF2336 domain-containing protein [Rhizobiales bacterium]|nr:DUF2336 domain-containing protein [Hyphomicrobiales bacterium]